MKHREKLCQIVKFVVFLVFLWLLFKFILLPTITSQGFKQFTESLGIFGYLIIIGYVVISHVFAPVAGTPGVALGVTIYGIKTGMWLLYIGSLISASINFGISKHFGRLWVIKLVGKQSMTKIDEFAAAEGRQILIISRLIGFALFDFISYAAGLTKLKYKDYIVITAVFGLIPNILTQFIFRDINFQSDLGIMIWMGSVGLAGIVFSILMRDYLKRQSKLNKDKHKQAED
jgi:uncharacterized membrane protein YdjX (TVP38/TMEM64 family)